MKIDPNRRRYELHFEGEVIHSDNLKQLQDMGRNMVVYYEIFQYVKSVPTESSRNQKLRLCDMEDAAKMIIKGFSKQTTAQKFHVHADYLMSTLRKNQLIK
jgi:hypothetical protein